MWEWYEWRRRTVAACEPNAAHRALADWQAAREGVRIATQNVDGLHGRAASDAGLRTDRDTPLELHGSLFRTRCMSCGRRLEHRDPIDTGSAAALPRCSGPETCGGLLRPDVVWFGEPLDSDVIGTAFRWAETADACLVIGTSAVVQPAAGLAGVTRERGGRVIEVNPERTPLSGMAVVALRGGAAEVVPRLLADGQPSVTSR